jgi:hypothetical protein
MARIQRPATLKEIVIHSLLAWREPAATIVDNDDEEPTLQLRRPVTDRRGLRSSR